MTFESEIRSYGSLSTRRMSECSVKAIKYHSNNSYDDAMARIMTIIQPYLNCELKDSKLFQIQNSITKVLKDLKN